jgi:NAD(P)H-dependent FMN reductase
MLKKFVFLMATLMIAPAFGQQILVISTSLNPHSKSVGLAQYAAEYLKSKGQKVDFIDLRKYNLQLANGDDQSAYDNPQVKELHDRIEKAQAIIIAAPIHNYGVAASAKNLVELTTHEHKKILSGKAWRNKVIGFIGVSGGHGSMLAFFPFINSLMMDSKVVVVPNFVMASSDDFNDQDQMSAETKKRIEELDTNLVKFKEALSK